MNPAHMPSARRVNTMYILLQMGFWGMMCAFTGYQTAVVQGRGFSSGTAGMFLALGCLAGMVAQPLLGAWADRHPLVPVKNIFGGCMLLALAVHAVFYFTRPGLAASCLIFLALGALETNAYPLVDAMAMQFINAGMNVRYSLGRGLGALSYAVVSVVTGRLAERFGVETALIVHACITVCILLTTAAFPVFPIAAHPAAQTKKAGHSPLYILRNNRPFALMLAAGFCGIAAVMPIVNFMVNLIGDRGGGSAELGTALFLMAASELPAAFLFQWLWKRCGSERVLLGAVAFMALKPLAFFLCRDLRLFLLLQPIQMLGYGLFTPANVYFANENVPVEDRIQGQSLKMVLTNGLGGTVGNLAAGYIIDWGGVNAMLAACFLVGALGVVFAVWSVRLRKREKKT